MDERRARAGEGPVRLYWTPASGGGGPDHGSPRRCFKIDGRPLEVRVWHRRPPEGYEAARHPSGVWLAIRFA